MGWYAWLLIGMGFGALGGYLLKDQLSEEYVSNVSMYKPKVKGKGNTMDADQITEVHMTKLTPKERRQARREARRSRRKNDS